MSATSPSVAVIGGGLSGLAAAHALRGLGARVVVYEAAARPGGVVGTHVDGDYLAETGPHGTRLTSALTSVVDELGLAEVVVHATPPGVDGYVVRRGRLVRLPQSLSGILATRALSWRAKARVLAERWVQPAEGVPVESVAAFFRRRFGGEPVACLVDPLVGALYGGDAERLAAARVCPHLVEAERAHGSVLRAAARHEIPRDFGQLVPPVVSFVGGMTTLTDALARALDGMVRLSTPVTGVTRSAAGWVVSAGRAAGDARRAVVDAVLYAGPAHGIAAIGWPDSVRQLTAPLSAMTYPPLAVVTVGFRRQHVAHPLDGWGLLVPEREAYAILGALFTSSVFPHRAPAGHVTLACYVGGVRRPALGAAPPDTVRAAVVADLRRLLGISGEPTYVHHAAWSRALPQYELGYDGVTRAITALEAAHPGLYFAGSFAGGVSVTDCLAAGRAAAHRIVAECALDQRLSIPHGVTASRAALADVDERTRHPWPSSSSTSSPSPPTATTSN